MVNTILNYIMTELLFWYYLPNSTAVFIGHWAAFILWQLFRRTDIIHSDTAIILPNAHKIWMYGMNINTHNSSFSGADIIREWRILQRKQTHSSLKLRLHEVNYKLLPNISTWCWRHIFTYVQFYFSIMTSSQFLKPIYRLSWIFNRLIKECDSDNKLSM